MSEQTLREIITLADEIKAKATAALPVASIVVPAEPDEPSGPICDAVDIQEAIKDLRPGQTLNVRPGAFYGDIEIDGKQGCTIRAIEPGATRISGLWSEADRGEVRWKRRAGYWAARHGDSHMAASDDAFLFKYGIDDALTGDRLLGKKKTDYGYGHGDGEMQVRLRDDANPNGKKLRFCDRPKRNLIKVRNSPEFSIDGFLIEGSGDADAIVYDSKSEGPHLRNNVFELCRRAARLPHNALVEWCEYTYPHFWRLYQDLVALNGEGSSALFDFGKQHWTSGPGNAALEGGFAESIYPGGSRGCEFHHNFYHEVWDGQRLGAFLDANSHHNVYYRCVDDAAEFENWSRKRSTAGNHEHHSLVEDAVGSGFSHQNTSGGMKGDHWASHCVFRNREVKSNFYIKIMRLNGKVNYAHCEFDLKGGFADGWGKMAVVARGMRSEALTKDLRLYNCVVTGDPTTGMKGEPDMRGIARQRGVVEAIDLPKGWPVERYAFIGPDVPDDLADWPRPKRRVFDR